MFSAIKKNKYLEIKLCEETKDTCTLQAIDTMKEVRGDFKQKERYSTFARLEEQHYRNDYTTKKSTESILIPVQLPTCYFYRIEQKKYAIT